MSDLFPSAPPLHTRNAFDHILDIWIVDNGIGMSAEIIDKLWMVIGTDAKEMNDRSASGRVVTGAKGIGRFALDRLGRECELFSGQATDGEIAHWIVNWGDFEGDGKIIDDVTAVLETEQQTMTDIYRHEGIAPLLPKNGPVRDDERAGEALSFARGTAIKISLPHDAWDERDSIRLKGTLEALLPPKDRGDFNIYVYDYRVPERSGWIDNFPPEQFDYRLTAKIEATGDIKITLNRREIDIPNIRPTTFTLPGMQKAPFRKADFEAGEFAYETTLRRLMRLAPDEDEADYRAIGPFDFTLYFMKLANPTAGNLKRYPQKRIEATKRRQWMGNAGGIRLYRDQFRVRPYGEPNTQGSDWLLLGQRVAANPAAASRPGWRVPPQQVAGTIHITKSENPLLSDQSNREGIMNERAFATFRGIILALIREFERDRSYIYSQFDQAYLLDERDAQKLEEGRALAEAVLAEAESEGGDPEPEHMEGDDAPAAKDDGQRGTPSAVPVPNKTVALAETVTAQTRKIELLLEEIQELRGMATLGTVLVSFTHELKTIKANMGSRQTRMNNALARVVDTEKLAGVPRPVNPYDMVARWGREDEKVGRWVDFALASISPAKRRRRTIELKTYFKGLADYWDDFVEPKQIRLDADPKGFPAVKILAHEIDLDSVFYNLIVNSIDAFSLPTTSPTRSISITTSALSEEAVTILYRDNGPGLSDLFARPDDIFNFGASSKKEASSDEISGTGLGMWLLKSIVDDYGGQAVIQTAIGEPGFCIAITLPLAPGAIEEGKAA